jgi:hypothetical protein
MKNLFRNEHCSDHVDLDKKVHGLAMSVGELRNTIAFYGKICIMLLAAQLGVNVL